MITAIEFLSAAEMRARDPDGSAVVVSVLDRSEASHRRSFEGFADALCLDFEDSSESNASEVFWPDEPTDAEHLELAQGRGERVPTLSDAAAIHAFVMKHHRGPRPLRLIAHCFGGISRSAAIAHWVSSVLWVPITRGHARDTDWANTRLLRLLDQAAGRR